MPLLTLANAELAYGDLPLLDRASFALEERERIGLIGRNGTGKSSLLGVLAGILPLENLLPRQPAAIFVTHDRAFLDRVATRILELDRGRLLSFPGNYAAYEKRKEEQLALEAVVHAKFDKFWAQEEAWIRRGIEARRTRNEGRVRRLAHLREERAERRARSGNIKLAIGEGRRSGRLVAELVGASKSFGERALVKDLDLIISRGDRVGLIGPNGAGKTTLLKLILGEIAPDSGRVRLGANVQPAYFDQ